ncbi:conserved hypothetical protein [Neospora caninum Liverpool]|uniref:RNA recognition motif-containing protein n=1 Tax=Neospora caninum (strain Liverpool) TaxID=572307 RepID=F0VPU6_NEOCL|nr:conserved hypothetical protein [Neospora caninum Liverpool]CBZ55743.1 conserved hypothetical protein [Neospora caninum Liverpool]|eukprot:XP_003885769.1 conserved hypothetical protein [Neospora caninum Liverpool]
MSHFLVKSAEFAQFESSRMVQREAERDARERREGRGTAKPSDAEGEDSGLKPRRVTQFSLLHPKQQRRLAEQAIVKVRIIRDKERRRASSPYLPLSWKESGSATAKEKRSLGFAFVDCAHAEVAKILLNFLGSCTSRDFLPENLAAQKDAGEETEDEERPRHGRSMWRRLMVEYAMEDARKVKLKEEKNRAYVQMLERQKKKNQEGEEGSQPPSSAKPSLPKKLKTYSRGKRQRERRRQARLAAAGVGESQSLLNGIENEKTFEKKEASQSASEANKKHVNDESKRTEGKKRKISREADESSAAEDEILVFDEEGEANAEEYLKNRVQFLLSNQG